MVRTLFKLKCKENIEQPLYAHHFYKCQWQKTNVPNLWYILYRWFMALFLLAVLLWSLFDVKRNQKSVGSILKWPTYLTNWAFTFATIQAFIGLWVVQSAWINRNKIESNEARKATLLHKIYWILNILAIDLAFTVSIIYWGLVHDPKVHTLDPVNLLVHAGNSVLMLFEICLVAHPCRFLFGFFSVLTGFTFSVFSYIYYACGGTDRNGNPYIYVPLDWRKPEKASVVCVMSMVLTFVLHCMVYGLFQLKNHITKTRNQEPIPTICLQEKSTLLDVCTVNEKIV